MRKVLVTGATGRLGGNVVASLKQRGHDVRCLVTEEDPKREKVERLGCEVFSGSLTQPERLRAAVKGVKGVVHLAAIMEEVPKGMTHLEFFDINTRGTFILMDAACEEVVEKFVYTSSTAAYDIFTARHVPVREDSPLLPRSEYGITKAASEAILMAMSFRYDLPLVILRPSYIMACEEVFALGKLWNTIIGLKAAAQPWCAFHVPGLGEPWTDLERQASENPDLNYIPYGPNGLPWHWHVTDVRDATKAVLLALDSDQVTRDILNIAGPRPTCFEEAVTYKCRKLGAPYEKISTPVYWRLEFDISKAQKVLGYKPEFDVIRMIDDALAYRAGKDIGVIPT